MRTAEGKNGLVLESLTFGQVAAVSDRAWREQRDSLIETLDMANVSDECRVKELKIILDRRGTRYSSIIHSLTINGASDIISTACKAQRIDFARFTDGMHPDELTTCAGELIGLVRTEEPQEGERKAATATS